jgi:hypothetical protein
MKLHAPAGIAIVAAHLAAFVALADRSAGTELQVYLPYVPLVSPHLSLPGEVPDALAGRVTIDSDGAGASPLAAASSARSVRRSSSARSRIPARRHAAAASSSGSACSIRSRRCCSVCSTRS